MSLYIGGFIRSKDAKVRNRGKWKSGFPGPTSCVVLSNMLPSDEWADVEKVTDLIEVVRTLCDQEFGHVAACVVPKASDVPLLCQIFIAFQDTAHASLCVEYYQDLKLTHGIATAEVCVCDLVSCIWIVLEEDTANPHTYISLSLSASPSL